ncbi:putative glycosyltransferase EpsJ [Lachnospiraceae bacterium]|nr:putative glycosyltransferase EpsJ [Lachnospiraceae bacterium]
MHTNYRFSIIIPVYNVEEYLKQCLDSVFAQTFLDYEVICIEDCSTDSSSEILRNYTVGHQIQVLHNDKNYGLSYARNRGMASAKGEYILFLDSDDYISENALEILAKELEKSDYDFLTFDSKKFYDENAKHILAYEPIRKNQYPETYEGQELYILQARQGDFKPTVWQYCYNKQYLERNNLQFVKGRFNEDELFSFYAFMGAKRIKVLPEVLHFYRIRNNSIMSPDKVVERLLDCLDNYIDYIHFYIHCREMNKGLLEECASFQVDRGSWAILDNYSKLTYEKRILFENSMRNDLHRIFMREILSRRDKKIFCSEAAQQLETYEKKYLYGAGKQAERVIRILEKEGIKLEGILVSKADENPGEFYHYRVYEYEKVKEKLSGALVIIGVSEKYSKGIISNLKECKAIGMLESKYLL